MVAATYPEAIRRVLLSEGGYVNHPRDPGGPTNHGITLATYRAFGHVHATADDIKAMPLEDAKVIYRKQYADPIDFNVRPAGLDYTLFDYAVNSGVGRSNKVIRRVCGLKDDAPRSDLEVALAKRDAKAVVGAVNAERLKFLQSLSTWPTFGTGWGRRVQTVNAAALKMADLKDAPIPSVLPPVAMPEPTQPQGKGVVPKPSTKGAVTSTSGVGGAAAGAGLSDWIAAHPASSAIIAAVALIAIAFVAEIIATHLQAKRQDAPTPGLIPVPETK